MLMAISTSVLLNNPPTVWFINWSSMFLPDTNLWLSCVPPHYWQMILLPPHGKTEATSEKSLIFLPPNETNQKTIPSEQFLSFFSCNGVGVLQFSSSLHNLLLEDIAINYCISPVFTTFPSLWCYPVSILTCPSFSQQSEVKKKAPKHLTWLLSLTSYQPLFRFPFLPKPLYWVVSIFSL